MARHVADHVAAGYYPADDGVSMIARQYGYDVSLIREIRTQLSRTRTPSRPVCRCSTRPPREPSTRRGR
jgi:transposase-like protein